MILGATAMDWYGYEHFFVLDGHFKLSAYQKLRKPAPVIILRLLEDDENSVLDLEPTQIYPGVTLREDNNFEDYYRISPAEWKIIPQMEKDEVNENFYRYLEIALEIDDEW